MVHAGDTLWNIIGRYKGKTYILAYLEDLQTLPGNKEILQLNCLLQRGESYYIKNHRLEKMMRAKKSRRHRTKATAANKN